MGLEGLGVGVTHGQRECRGGGALLAGQGGQGPGGEGSRPSSGLPGVTRAPQTHCPPPPPWVCGSVAMAELDWWVGSASPTGFLEKNRDMLSTDILTLVYSSENKFLKEIFNLESAGTKLGHGTIILAKTGSQLFKVVSQGGSCQCLLGPSAPRASGVRRVHTKNTYHLGLSCSVRAQK